MNARTTKAARSPRPGPGTPPSSADPPFAAPNWPGPWKMWRLDKITEHPRNARTHPAAQITLLAGMLKKWGPDQPIVVDEAGVILKGHGRKAAALEAGFEEFPVIQRRGMSEADKTAMRLSDNQIALLAGWNSQLVASEIGELRAAGYDIPLLGFGEAQLRGWGVAAAAAGTADPEAMPEPPKRATVRAGDLWCLGQHRLFVGDSTEPETWKRLFGRERAAMVFSDPPYGVSYEGGDFAIIKGDDKRRDDLYRMLVGAFKNLARITTDTAAFYIWHADKTRQDFSEAMTAAGLVERQYLIWVKPSLIIGPQDYQLQSEPCFYASKPDRSPAFYGDRAQPTVWHAQLAKARDIATTIGTGVLLLDGAGHSLFVQTAAPKGKKLRQIRIGPDSEVFLSGADHANTSVWQVGRDSGYEHPTQKPVELARRAIENSSKPGEIVADGFLGSFATGIACEMTGRRCWGCEIDPVYVEVGIRRWQKFSGQIATLAETGETLEQIGRKRAPKPARGRRDAPQDVQPASGRTD